MLWMLACVEPPVHHVRTVATPSDPPPPTTHEPDPATTPTTEEPCGEPFEPLLPYDPPDELLCEIPAGYVEDGGDPVHPDCPLAAGGSSDRAPDEVLPTLSIAAWNVEFGAHQEQVLAELTTTLAGVDFLLLSEVARHDGESDPADIDQVEELAAATHMFYAYAVEWDRREDPALGGEHGVAVLSKYPLGNAELLRLPAVNDWWDEEQLYGGRLALGVDAKVGCTNLRLYSMHLDTRGLGDAGRARQGEAVRADADASGTALQLAGGDWNTWNCNPLLSDCNDPPAAEQIVEDFLADGWVDGVASDAGWTQLGEGFFPQKLDWVFHRGGLVPVDGEIVRSVDGSDHVPVVFRFALP